MKTYGITIPETPSLADVLDVIAEVARPAPGGASAEPGLARADRRLALAPPVARSGRLHRHVPMRCSRALDRWLWKQRHRETEAWLAQSQDIFELEARIRELEREPARPHLLTRSRFGAAAPLRFRAAARVDARTVIPL